MRLKMIRQLVSTNIIYATQPAQLSKYRKQQEKRPDVKINVAAKSIRTYLFLGVLYLFIFGILFSFNDLVSSPGLFSNMVALFGLISLSQGFLSFYNVFYESKDLQAYRPYAFSNSEIFIAKGVSVLLTLLIALLPMISYFFILPIQARENVILGLLAGLLSAGIFMSVLCLITIIGVHFITKSAIFRAHKTIISNLLLGIVSLASMGGYLYLNVLQGQSYEMQENLQVLVPPLAIFHSFILSPLDGTSLLGMLGWVLVLLALVVVIKYKVVPEFYDAALKTESVSVRKVRVRKLQLGGKTSFRKFVGRYHLRLLSDSSVVLQTIFMSTILPYIFIFSVYLGASKREWNIHHSLTPQFLLPLALIAFSMGSLHTTAGGLTSIGISLERENLDYLHSLPIDFKAYLRLKFWTLFGLQSILPALLFLVVSFLFGLHPISFLVMMIVMTLTAIFWSSRNYYKDYKHLMTNWSNINDLLARENNMLKSILIVVSMFVMIMLIGFAFYISIFLASALVCAIVIAFMVILALASYFTYKSVFRKLDQEVE